MSGFRVPTFNLQCDLYDNFPNPFTRPARATVDCALAWGRRTNSTATGGTGIPGVQVNSIALILPALTDIRGDQNASMADYVDVPAGSGRHYKVTHVDDVAKGYDNEYRIAILEQVYPWPTPIP